MSIDFAVAGDGPAVTGEEVTPNDGADLTILARALYIGGAGDVAVRLRGNTGVTITLVGLLAGVIYPIAAQRVMSTATTATNIVALA